jgi:alpha-L-fucosidase
MPGEDYQIFERDVPGENSAGYSGQAVSRLPLETCQTINGSWGFNITDNNYKSTRELIALLVRTAGVGGNLLLNVGPAPDGRITPQSVERLREMGEWLSRWGHTIYGTTAGPIAPQKWGAVTRRGDKIYIHILDAGEVLRATEGPLTLKVPGFRTARWLNVEEGLDFSRDRRSGEVTFNISGARLDEIDSIIEVTVE